MTSWSFQWIKERVSLVAGLVVISGIVFAVLQFRQSERLERQRVAIEAITHLRSEAFIDAFLRIKTSVAAGHYNLPSLHRDIRYVVSWYDHVAILYLSGLADQCVVKHTIYYSASEMAEILNALEKPYPPELRRNFDLLLNRMAADPCG